MRLKEWAAREGIHSETAYRWCRENKMPVPFTKTASGMIMVHDPRYENVELDKVNRVQ